MNTNTGQFVTRRGGGAASVEEGINRLFGTAGFRHCSKNTRDVDSRAHFFLGIMAPSGYRGMFYLPLRYAAPLFRTSKQFYLPRTFFFFFNKDWQIYSEGAHFQEAKGEGGRGGSSPPPFLSSSSSFSLRG